MKRPNATAGVHWRRGSTGSAAVCGATAPKTTPGPDAIPARRLEITDDRDRVTCPACVEIVNRGRALRARYTGETP